MIIPAVLTNNFNEFKLQAQKLGACSNLVQIDVMDGIFVSNKSFVERAEINNLSLNLNFELHLMVARPLEELDSWKSVKNITRIIFHLESKDNPDAVITAIRGCCGSVGIAINPETNLERLEPYAKQINEVLFMTVHPGEQGARFLPEVGEKIKQFKRNYSDILIGVDGGVNLDTISLAKSWGADVFCVGSALSQAADPMLMFKNLKLKIEN